MPTRVGTAAYSCKTRAVRAEMRRTIYTAVEHPGDLTVYRNGEFFSLRILRFRAEKNLKTCGSMCFHWNISPLLSSPVGEV